MLSEMTRLREPLIAGLMLVPFAWVFPVGSAVSAVHVGPNQTFQALINGHTGSPSPVIISMACVGPIHPGETGHPSRGQTITVRLAPGTGTSFGYTGSSANSIRAFFGPPPPGGTGSSTNSVTFTVYRTLPLPTSLVLPCAGTSRVFFVPLPMSPPTSRSATVPVRYVGQP
jgi:hypothetical protein